MTTDVFLRSYAADLPWIPYALRSLDQFVTGIRNIIVSVPESDYKAFKSLNLTREKLIVSMAKIKDGYCEQQLDKLWAYEYTGADQIMFWDSDVIAIRPFSPSDLMVDGKPRWLITPYAELVNKDGTSAVPWLPVVIKAIGIEPSVECMRQHPFMVPRQSLLDFEQFMQKSHGIPLDAYIDAQPDRRFSEFNVLGSWAYFHHPHLFHWINTAKDGVPEPFVRQFWSYSGLTDAERLEMEAILK